MKQSTKNYFKEIRNWYHFIVGVTAGYLITLVLFSNREKFPISWEYWNNALYPLAGGVFVAIASLLWEKRGDKIKPNSSDMRDVWFSSVSAVLGGYLSMIYASWYIAIPMTVLSAYLIIKHNKK